MKEAVEKVARFSRSSEMKGATEGSPFAAVAIMVNGGNLGTL